MQAGLLAPNELLFKEYNAKATPKDISPFAVRVFSTEIVPDELYMLGSRDLIINRKNSQQIEPIKIQNMQRSFLGYELEMINSYQFLRHQKLRYHERRASWNRFKTAVEKLAAQQAVPTSGALLLVRSTASSTTRDGWRSSIRRLRGRSPKLV